MHFSFSIMVAAIVPWPPWCHPSGSEAYNNQPSLLLSAVVSARVAVEDTVLRY